MRSCSVCYVQSSHDLKLGSSQSRYIVFSFPYDVLLSSSPTLLISEACGLDYYMGLIYKAIVKASALPGLKATEKPDPTPAVPKKKSGMDEDEEIHESQVGVGLSAAGGWYDDLMGMFTAAALSNGKKGAGLLPECMVLVQELRAQGIVVDFLAKNKLKLNAQFAVGGRDEVPYAVILGGEELKVGLVTGHHQGAAMGTCGWKEGKGRVDR
ncbi:hypothetical protein EDB92DRAFT_1800771 [Lactarius akahatsu]|uniref:Anticodon-binding domain-containing protein n=1 Tax=Lactarius akahatsu TaxID=416441 RepID=A0AAD4LCN6_9AGAM|nr:hypothetical protein EDB92DRAFT_1800771 [Lactarius akahatsu]